MKIEGRILCLDVGDRRIGLALSDGLQLTAQPFKIIDRKSGNIYDQLAEIIEDFEVGAILFGIPRNKDNRLGTQAEKTREFMRRLSGKFPGLSLFGWDERYSSKEAERIIDLEQTTWQQKKKALDKVAAAIILQGFLERLRDSSFQPTPYNFS
ncbi:MAG: Holliday junction resolvase RuvX [bacterium]